MGMCSDAPDYPKAQMQAQIDASKELGDRYLNLSEQQQSWAEEQWNQTYSLLQETLGVQTEVQLDQLRNAQADRQRYEEKFQPIEDDLLAEFRDYDSPERRNLESGRAQAGVQQGFDLQRRNAEKRLEGYGIDPSETRGQAIDNEARIAMAATQAAAGNNARTNVQNTGRALRSDAINIGKGLPSQVAQSYGQTLQASQQNTNAQGAAIASGANTMGTGGSWGAMGSNQIGATMGGINSSYSGQLAGYNAGNAGIEALGSVAGTALGGYIGAGGQFGMGAEGGRVPEDTHGEGIPVQPAPTPRAINNGGPEDQLPTMLAPGEYVIPAEVVRRKGTDFFDKLKEKAAEQEAMDAQRAEMETMQAAGIPQQAQPQPQAIRA